MKNRCCNKLFGFFIVVYVVLLIVPFSFSQSRKLRKNFEKINENNFEEVAQNLHQLIAKEPASPFAPFLLSMYFGKNSNSKRNIDSSFYYFEKSKDLINVYIDVKDLEEACLEIRCCKYNFSYQFDSIIEVAYHEYNDKNTVVGMKRFLQFYGEKNRTFYDKATQRLDALLFEEAVLKKSIKTLERFIVEYPRSNYLREAKEKIEELAYDEVVSQDNETEYNNFLEKYPNSKFKSKVEVKRNEKAYANVIKINSEESYNQFLKNYPYAIQVSDVIKKRDEIAYSNVLKVNTIEAFSKFIKNYPKALQIKDVTDRRDIMAYDVAVNLNTEQSFDEFVKKYPTAKQNEEAIYKRDHLAYNTAEIENTGESFDAFVTKYPTSDLAEDAIARRDNLFFNAAKNSGNTFEIQSFIDKFPNSNYNEKAVKVLDSISIGARLGKGLFDIDGNKYKTVIIGDQEWMAENLRTSKYTNGKPIPNLSKNDQWNSLNIGGCSMYNHLQNNNLTYGRLYNWYAVNTGNLCPTGWYVPSSDDWNELIQAIGGEDVAGGKLKESGLNLWQSPNEGGTNNTLFRAKPAGYRDANGYFGSLGNGSYWWTSSGYNENGATYFEVKHDHGKVESNSTDERYGFSVRCIKSKY